MASSLSLGQKSAVGVDDVLDTPLSIYETAMKQFPSAHFQVTTDPLKLELLLSKDISIRITSAVSRQLFLLSLLEVKTGTNKKMKNDFSVSKPLIDWKPFYKEQRRKHEANGSKCFDVIIKYLREKETKDLITLGLAPEQLTTEEAAIYFKEIEQHFPNLIPLLKEKYRIIFQPTQQLLCKQDLERKSAPSDYEQILSKLKMRVFGQEVAVKIAASVLAEDNRKTGVRNHRAFLFVGPTGVGKTELALTISSLKDKCIIFYMNQYTSESAATLFFGSPSGYVGSTAKSVFASELDKCKNRSVTSDGTVEIRNIVLLFDELEKAHPKLRTSLLTLVEKGEAVISYTEETLSPYERKEENKKIIYRLINSVIIGTSNLFQREILQAFQTGQSEEEIAKTFTHLNAVSYSEVCFQPEYLGRFRITPFGPIPHKTYKELLGSKFKGFIQDLKEVVSCKEVVVENEELFFGTLCTKLYGDGTDIRKVKRYFDDIKSIVISVQSNWGDVTNKKIIFYTNHGQIQIKLHTFCLGEYIDTSSELPPLLCEVK